MVTIKSIDEYYGNTFEDSDIRMIIITWLSQEGDYWFGDWSYERFRSFTAELLSLGFDTAAAALNDAINEHMSRRKAIDTAFGIACQLDEEQDEAI